MFGQLHFYQYKHIKALGRVDLPRTREFYHLGCYHHPLARCTQPFLLRSQLQHLNSPDKIKEKDHYQRIPKTKIGILNYYNLLCLLSLRSYLFTQLLVASHKTVMLSSTFLLLFFVFNTRTSQALPSALNSGNLMRTG